MEQGHKIILIRRSIPSLSTTTMEQLHLLILGAGWTATFLIPLLRARKVPFEATTRDGRDVAGEPTIRWDFDPRSPDARSTIASLPRARCVLVTFPLKGQGPSRLLVEAYTATHGTEKRNKEGEEEADEAGNGEANRPSSGARFIQLGSTGIWRQPGEGDASAPWMTRRSAYDKADARAVAEDELLSLGGCVLELAGLWGGARDPRHWVDRVGGSKEAVRAKTSLHMVHGLDVARAIIAVAGAGDDKWSRAAAGQRWMLTDGFVYDWWALFAGWADGGRTGGEDGDGDGIDVRPRQQATWVFELMAENQVRALPRPMGQLGRCYDSREFWATFGLVPVKARV